MLNLNKKNRFAVRLTVVSGGQEGYWRRLGVTPDLPSGPMPGCECPARARIQVTLKTKEHPTRFTAQSMCLHTEIYSSAAIAKQYINLGFCTFNMFQHISP